MCDMDMGHFANTNSSMAAAKFWYLGFVKPDRTPDESFLSLCHRGRVVGLSMLY